MREMEKRSEKSAGTDEGKPKAKPSDPIELTPAKSTVAPTVVTDPGVTGK